MHIEIKQIKKFLEFLILVTKLIFAIGFFCVTLYFYCDVRFVYFSSRFTEA